MKFSISLFFSTIVMIVSLTAQIDSDFLKRKSLESDVAVIGRVFERESFWSANKKMIFTSNKIEILGIIKGEAHGIIEIITYGGEVDDRFQIWSHERTLDSDDMGYFFLKEDRTHFAKPQSYYLLNGDDSFIPLPQKTTFASTDEESALTDKVVEFGFDNIQILPANKFSFDLLIRTNEAGVGLEFGYGEVLARYSDLVFGTYVDSTGRLEVEKETVISSPNYILFTEDFTSDIFRTLISGGCNSTGSLLTTGIPLSTVFQKLLSITIEIQDITAIGTISLDEFQMEGNIYYFDPNTGNCLPFDVIIYPNPIETGLVCNISAFSSDLDLDYPDRTAAGTDNILTITGMNFGNSPGAVEFQNADVPGGALAATHIVDFMPNSGGSWTDTQIKVKVPSWPISAGSGVFQVRTSGNMVCPSPAPLEICYAATTFRNTTTNEVRKIYLADYPDNGDGQFVFRLDAGLGNNMNAKRAIEMAICDWHALTEINWTIGEVYAGPSPSVDNVNHIFLAPAGVFATNPGANMRTIFGGERVIICNDISNMPPIFRNHTTDIDIAVRADLTQMTPPVSGGWNFNSMAPPGANQLDFYSIIQHELGHAHLLTHALDNSKKMYPTSLPGTSMRTISNKDGMGGNHIIDISHADLNPVCPTAVGRSVNCSVVSVENFSFTDKLEIFPNPFTEEITLNFALTRGGQVKIELFNILGDVLVSKDMGDLNSGKHSLSVLLDSGLPSGIYVLTVRIAGLSQGYKLVKI